MNLPWKTSVPEKVIEDFCLKWDISRLEVFGSALTNDLGPESDIDFLVTFTKESALGLDFFDASEELSRIFSRKVDLISHEGLRQSRNKFRNRQIIERVLPIYVKA